MAFGFDFQKSGSKQKSKSESGLPLAFRKKAADEFFPFFQQIPDFVSDFRTFQTPQLNLAPTGLTQSQNMQAERLLGRQLTRNNTLVSSANALRGQVSPLNLSGIVTDASSRAMTNVLPLTLQLAGQNELFNAQSPMEAEKTRLLGTLGSFEAISKLFQGSSSKGVGSASGFGFGVETKGGALGSIFGD